MKEKLNISVTDIDLYRNHIYNKDKLKSLDVNSRFKRFRFSYNGLLINLDNITVRAYMIKPDKKEIFNDLSIVNENIVELEFTNQALLVPGTLKLELVLYEDDAELSSFLIEYEIVKSLRTDNSIESSNEYTSLQIALQKIELWNKNYQKLYDKWNTDLSNLHSSKSDLLDKLKATKLNELNKLKKDKSNELTTLYNSKDEELNNLKNTWDAEFRKKYDGLNKEYSNRVSSIEEDINSVKKEGSNLKSSLDSEYFNINRGILTDFNNGTLEGKYYLSSNNLIPNSPPTSQTSLYGIVQVLYKSGNELFQIATLHNSETWIRFKNTIGEWYQWNKVPTMKDFEYRHGEHGYQKLPGGLILQWGSMTINIGGNSHSAKQDIVYPVAFKNPAFFVAGNIDNVDFNGEGITNDFTLHVFNLDRVAGATVVINNVLNPYGSIANIKWYAIGV
ncbi:choline binding protein [[Clostridium] sordellii]|uniref:gp53-like domain-containing protein n=1 Tax=Paraclostridium sordellii TaxID=1505 RepID=UPI0005442303|nr:pyocin knob domain-containing protein [Paeniclostridium sordellii]CEK35504.1 choline binding protein [[Clostridium] sordellii] [Paeniclostridium sordellii]